MSFDSRLLESNIDRKQVICTEEGGEGSSCLMKRRGGGGLNFHAVRDAAVDIYRPPSLLILLPLLPSFSSGSLTVTDALGISPGVLLSFVAKISGKKSTLSPYERRKEGRK